MGPDLSLLQFFSYDHLDGPRRDVSQLCANLAHQMAETLGNSGQYDEVTTGLRKLLEAKDCFVRATLPLAQ